MFVIISGGIGYIESVVGPFETREEAVSYQGRYNDIGHAQSAILPLVNKSEVKLNYQGRALQWNGEDWKDVGIFSHS